jgi:hypothetical protein
MDRNGFSASETGDQNATISVDSSVGRLNSTNETKLSNSDLENRSLTIKEQPQTPGAELSLSAPDLYSKIEENTALDKQIAEKKTIAEDSSKSFNDRQIAFLALSNLWSTKASNEKGIQDTLTKKLDLLEKELKGKGNKESTKKQLEETKKSLGEHKTFQKEAISQAKKASEEEIKALKGAKLEIEASAANAKIDKAISNGKRYEHELSGCEDSSLDNLAKNSRENFKGLEEEHGKRAECYEGMAKIEEEKEKILQKEIKALQKEIKTRGKDTKNPRKKSTCSRAKNYIVNDDLEKCANDLEKCKQAKQEFSNIAKGARKDEKQARDAKKSISDWYTHNDVPKGLAKKLMIGEGTVSGLTLGIVGIAVSMGIPFFVFPLVAGCLALAVGITTLGVLYASDKTKPPSAQKQRESLKKGFGICPCSTPSAGSVSSPDGKSS